ncbi:MAG: hypothetical protein WC933_02785 [Candidatus Paceibacterota bacterium]|jgi:hypothetical protein
MSPQIEVSDEELKQIKEKLGIVGKEIQSYEDLVGEKIFFRTVTYHALGEVKKIVGRFVHLKNASWIADTGRFMNFIKDGVQENSEVEPVGEMFLNLDTVVDFFIWNNKLPKEQK